MRSKLIGIFFTTFLVCVGLLVWHMDRLIFSDRLAWSEAQARSQMAALIFSGESELRLLQEKAERFLTLGGLQESQSQSSGFLMVAELNGTPPSLGRIISREGSEVAKWGPNYATVILKSVSTEVRSSQVFAFLDPQRKPHLFLYYPRAQGAPVIAILESRAFQALVDRQKGQVSQVFLVNSSGQTLAHTEPEYVASDLSGDPLVARIKSGQVQGFGIFKDFRGQEVQGLFEQVGATNIFVVISTPLGALFGERSSTLIQLGLVGFGAALVAMALLLLLYREKHVVAVTTPSVEGSASGSAGGKSEESSHKQKASASNSSVVGPSEAAVAEARSQAYSQAAASLAHELKGPLAAILGHAKLAKGHPEEVRHIELIEEEAREAREVVRKLLVYARQDDGPKRRQKLRPLVERALKNLESELKTSGIHVEQKVDPNFEVEANDSSFVYAMEQIIKNAIESMDKVARKDLQVLTVSEGEGLRLLIKDTGSGLDTETMQKAFDPFFTTRARQHHLGMGLPSAMGIIKELGGQINLSSELGEGTTVEVSLPEPGAISSEASLATQSAEPQSHAKPQLKPEQQSPAPTPVPAAPKPAPSVQSEESMDRTVLAVPEDIVEASYHQPSESQPGADLLANDDIERLIDEIPEPEVMESTLVLEDRLVDDEKTVALMPSPPEDFVPSSPSEIFSGKVDKPVKINIKKKESVLEKTEISVRRPGAKS